MDRQQASFAALYAGGLLFGSLGMLFLYRNRTPKPAQKSPMIDPISALNNDEQMLMSPNTHRDVDHLLKLLLDIAEEQASKEGFIHRGITCNHCQTSPLKGIRYKCANCVDFDLCEDCEAEGVHTSTHVFIKIRIPIPPLANPRSALLNVFYPGKVGENQPRNGILDDPAKLKELLKRTHCTLITLFNVLILMNS